MKKSSLLKKILTPILILVMVGGTVLTYVNYSISADTTKELLVQDAISVTAQSDKFFNDFFAMKGESVLVFSELPAMKNALVAPEETNKSLAEILEHSDSLLNAYMATETGEFYVHPQVDLPEGFVAKERPWYKETVQSGDTIVWQKPYIDTASGQLTITASTTVKDASGKVVGVFGIDIDLDKFGEYLKDAKIGESGYVYVMDFEGNVLSHPNEKVKGTNLSKDEFAKRILDSKENHGGFSYAFNKEKNQLVFEKNDIGSFVVVGKVPVAEFEEKSKELLLPMSLILLGIIAAIGVSVWFNLKKTLKPLKELHKGIIEVEKGDFSVNVKVKSTDEIGELTKGFNHMISQVGNLIQAIEVTAGEVKAASNVLVVSTDENAKAITETSVTMEQIAGGASKQAELVEENTNKINELSDQLERMGNQSDNIQQGSEVMSEASQVGVKNVAELREQSKKTTEMTNEMVKAIRSLDNNSKNISAIITAIGEIADQTNLLALNAAIEAARAGEQGKGFAVVADEVRKLAEKSAGSSKEIETLIKQMIDEMQNTVSLIENTHKTIQKQDEIVGETGESFTLISDTISDNKKNIEGIVQLIEEMMQKKDSILASSLEITAITQETAAGTEEVSASIEEQSSSMEQLHELSDNLGRQADKLMDEFKNLNK